ERPDDGRRPGPDQCLHDPDLPAAQYAGADRAPIARGLHRRRARLRLVAAVARGWGAPRSWWRAGRASWGRICAGACWTWDVRWAASTTWIPDPGPLSWPCRPIPGLPGSGTMSSTPFRSMGR